jgi:hypothetical protein
VALKKRWSNSGKPEFDAGPFRRVAFRCFGWAIPDRAVREKAALRHPGAIAIVGLDATGREIRRRPMTQTSNRLFDEMARLMNDAAGVAQGVRREVETAFRGQAERWLNDLDLVKREELDAVKEMARLAREENEALKARIAALEAKLGQGGVPPGQ